jgi:hypothetical protein
MSPNCSHKTDECVCQIYDYTDERLIEFYNHMDASYTQHDAVHNLARDKGEVEMEMRKRGLADHINEQEEHYNADILAAIRNAIDEEFTNLQATHDFDTDRPPGYLYEEEVYDWIVENVPDEMSSFMKTPDAIIHSDAILDALKDLGHITEKLRKIAKIFTAVSEQEACKMGEELLDKESPGNDFEVVKADEVTNESTEWGT